ncbi:MAG: MalT-like region [Acidobacteriota bacterium]|nr:MalT-like region [Acidobacteriota bacterium]
MEETHLSVETLARWLSGGLEHEEMLRLVIPHFLARCPVCRERREEIARMQKEVGHWNEEVVVLEGQEAPELWERLAERPYAEQLRTVEEDEGLHAWGLCQLLLKRSREAVFNDPGEAVELANLALRVVRHLGTAYDPNWVMDLRARCFAYLGNARRVLGELRSADDAFVKAQRCLARSSSGNSEIQAEVLSLTSSLRRAQRRLDEALELIDRALVLYRGSGELKDIGKSLLKKAKILEEIGELIPAIDLLRAATAEIDRSSEPRLFTYARYNLLGCLIQAGQIDEAERLLPEVRDSLRDNTKELDQIRLRWVEGNVDFALGRLGPAEAAFREVQHEFLERRMGYDAALVSLDLALLFTQEGCVEDLKRLAAELMPVFESRDVHREAIVALLMFQRACEEEKLTVELVRQFAEYLRRERRGNGM